MTRPCESKQKKKKNKKKKQIDKKKRTLRTLDFTIPVDHKIKVKESEKRDKYLDIARELNTLWNMKVTVIPIVIGILGKILKGMVKGLEDLEIRR